MTVTKILGAQSGLQYQGVQDKSEADPRDSLTNALFTGEFKRGPFNKPFKVTQANIRAKLGFDPENIQYQAIEDLLKQGVPFIWVMRIDTELKWGPWQINEMNILGAVARFIGSKTNTRETYNGSAQIDLTVAITASLSDSNMQRWQAVTDACNELTGMTEWTFDLASNQIIYLDLSQPVDSRDPTVQYFYHITNSSGQRFEATTPEETCKLYIEDSGMVFDGAEYWPNGSPSSCLGHALPSTEIYSFGSVSKELNPAYDPNAKLPKSYKSFAEIAQKIISNASSSDQGISLLAETYIQEVAKGVTLDNLIDQFEQNKIKR